MSLFNKPTWAKSQTTTEDIDSGTSLFSHRERSFHDIVAEQERKKQAKLDRKKHKEERRSSSKRETQLEQGEDSNFKRRRVSVEADTSADRDDPVWELPTPKIEQQPSPRPSNHGTPRRSPRKNKYFDSAAAEKQWLRMAVPDVIELGGSDTEDDGAFTTTGATGVEGSDDEAEDEFAGLARRAREERLGHEPPLKASLTSASNNPSRIHTVSTLDTGQSVAPDPTIQIFITSRLPDTKELIVYRRFSQNLGVIKKIWCQKQGFTEEATKDVFFIHRMRRVYDVTTCRSLGLDVDSFGNVILKGAEDNADVDKVHLEAVTDELFQWLKEERAKEPQDGSHNQAAEDDGDDEEVLAAQPEASLIRLVIKGRDMADFKLKVKPTTTFAKIVSAYAKTHPGIGQSAYLTFDGERLDPNDEFQTSDIADMDCIEIHESG